MRAGACAALLAVIAAAASGEVRDREEQLIYSLTVFNGTGYSSTFGAESSGTLYLLADADNFVTLRKTFVYYRPADAALKTDAALLDAVVEGVLKISGSAGDSQSLPMEDYTYYYYRPGSEAAAAWRTAAGPEAHRVYLDYTEKVRRFREGMDDYRLDRATYDYVTGELERRIRETEEAGGDVTRLEQVLRGLDAPARPAFPEEYAVRPVRVDRAFIVNLPAGRYRARLVGRGGRILEGSEKTIVAFGRLGEPTVGYEVIPGDRWTRPVESRSSGSVIYVDGSSDLYLVASYQHEFTDLFYEKLIRNDARGSPGMRRRVSFQVIPGVRLALLSRGGVTASIGTLPTSWSRSGPAHTDTGSFRLTSRARTSTARRVSKRFTSRRIVTAPAFGSHSSIAGERSLIPRCAAFDCWTETPRLAPWPPSPSCRWRPAPAWASRGGAGCAVRSRPVIAARRLR